ECGRRAGDSGEPDGSHGGLLERGREAGKYKSPPDPEAMECHPPRPESRKRRGHAPSHAPSNNLPISTPPPPLPPNDSSSVVALSPSRPIALSSQLALSPFRPPSPRPPPPR